MFEELVSKTDGEKNGLDERAFSEWLKGVQKVSREDVRSEA